MSNSNIAVIAESAPILPVTSVNIPGMKAVLLQSYYNEFADYYPNAEMNTKRWFVENVKEDWNLLDIGANVGYYTVMFSRLAPKGKVYAIEPTDTISMLAKNLEYNGTVENVEIIKEAFGKDIGNKKDKVFRIWGEEPENIVYKFNTIDNFVKERNIKIDAIKIDVDSFDFEVLQGAKETIRTQNPYIMVELNYALHKRFQHEADALRWMAERGYVSTEIYDGENYLFKLSDDESKLDPAYRMSSNLTLKWR
jgi:FkbM family methyltransferase